MKIQGRTYTYGNYLWCQEYINISCISSIALEYNSNSFENVGTPLYNSTAHFPRQLWPDHFQLLDRLHWKSPDSGN